MPLAPYDTLPDDTRVWIYQSNRPLTDTEVQAVREELQAFVQEWVSHNRQLRAHGDVWHRTFIVLLVDESQAGASGCSIDKSVYFLKSLQDRLGVDLFDRMAFAYREGEAVNVLPKAAFQEAYTEGRITDDTPVFDNLVDTKAAFERQWEKPLRDSWHKRFVGR